MKKSFAFGLIAVITVVFLFVGCSPEKTKVSSPSSVKITYTGKQISAPYTETQFYTVSGDLTGTAVGEYSVSLSLKDKKATCWENGSSDDLSVIWSITKTKVIILTGQSNAAGNSWIRYLSEEDKLNYENGFDSVKILVHNALTYNSYNDFVPVTLGMGDSDELIGPEVGMAEVLSTAYPDETVYIVKYGWSGAKLVDATNATFHPENTTSAYKGLTDTIDAAIEKLNEDEIPFEIVGFCWMQGESDGTRPDWSNLYKDVEKNFVTALRSRYADYSIQDGFFFVDAASNDAYHWPWYQNVNNAKKQNADEDYRWFYIDTIAEGLTTANEPYGQVDLAHYDIYSEIKLGELFGNAIIEGLSALK